jgi:hypothetical protein
VILHALILLFLPVLWLVAAAVAVAACRAASRADAQNEARLALSAGRQGSRGGDSPAGRSDAQGSYGLAVSQGV